MRGTTTLNHISYFVQMHHEPRKFICDQSTIKGNLLQGKKKYFWGVSWLANEGLISLSPRTLQNYVIWLISVGN